MFEILEHLLHKMLLYEMSKSTVMCKLFIEINQLRLYRGDTDV